MIYVTGDTHGEQARILLLEQQACMRAGDTLIVCGDFGYLFLNDRNEEYHQAYRNLSKCGNTVDYILTHTMPREAILRYGRYPDVHDMELTGFLE